MLRSKAFFAPIIINCFARVYSLPRVSVVGSCLLSASPGDGWHSLPYGLCVGLCKMGFGFRPLLYFSYVSSFSQLENFFLQINSSKCLQIKRTKKMLWCKKLFIVQNNRLKQRLSSNLFCPQYLDLNSSTKSASGYCLQLCFLKITDTLL